MDLSKVVIKLQSSLEQKGPATQRKGKLLLSQCLLLSSRRIKCRNKSHQRLRQFLSPREDWLTTKPRRNSFTWNKSDLKMSRPREAPRLTCPRGQLTAHYDAKGKVHLLTSAMNVNITVHRSSFYRDGTWATQTTKNQTIKRNCITDTNVRWAILTEDHGIMP